MLLSCSNPALHLQDAHVLRIMIQLNGLHLAIVLCQRGLLHSVLPLEVNPYFALFIKASILFFHNIHLEHSAHGVLLCRSDAYLLPVVLQLGDHVIDNSLKVIQVSAHRELFFTLFATKKGMLLSQQHLHSALRGFHLVNVDSSRIHLEVVLIPRS